MNLNWFWKIFGAILILYSLIWGLYIPLKPGIVSVNPNRSMAGDTIELAYEAYNVDYARRGKNEISAWLLMDSTRIIAAEKIEVTGPRSAKGIFHLPLFQTTDPQVISATLVVSDSLHGYALLPSALAIQMQDSTSTVEQGELDFAKVQVAYPPGRTFPFRNILKETIRNTYYHVPLWFSMIILFLLSAYNSFRYLRTREKYMDIKARSLAEIGIILGVLGLITGAIWARFTWGAFWSWDVKQFTSAVALLIYLSYFILRSSITDADKRGRLTASYNIFAFVLLIPLLFIIPRLTDSLHPGNGGNPAMGGEDLDATMRWVFYPAVIGWILMGLWLSDLKSRYLLLHKKKEDELMSSWR
jgi:heme exporter protein C